MSGGEANKRSDIFPSAVFIDGVIVMGRIQKEFFNMEPRKISFHREKGKHIMPGSPLKKREDREVTVGIGSHIHVGMVTKEIAFPMGIPSPVAVGLGIMTFTAAGRTALLLTVTDPFFPLLGGSSDGSAVTGKSQMARNDQTVVNGTVQELSLIKLENEEKGIFRL